MFAPTRPIANNWAGNARRCGGTRATSLSAKGLLEVIDDPATSRYRTRRKHQSGGGGLVSTARDNARFCQMLLNGGELQGVRLLRAETVKEMTRNQPFPERGITPESETGHSTQSLTSSELEWSPQYLGPQRLLR